MSQWNQFGERRDANPRAQVQEAGGIGRGRPRRSNSGAVRRDPSDNADPDGLSGNDPDKLRYALVRPAPGGAECAAAQGFKPSVVTPDMLW